MNVLLAVHGFPPNQSAGSELQAFRIARGLLARGVTVQVISTNQVRQAAAGSHQLSVALDHVDGVPVQRIDYAEPLEPSSLAWEYANPLIYDHIAAQLAQGRFDLLHLISGYRMSGSALEAAERAGVPTVIMPMDFWFFCPRITLIHVSGRVCDIPDDPRACTFCLAADRRRYRLPEQWSQGAFGRTMTTLWRNPAMRLLSGVDELDRSVQARRTYLQSRMAHAACVIANSDHLGRLFAQRGVEPNRIRVIRQGLDQGDWLPATPATRSADELHIGYVGQIAAHKGIDVLIQAVQRLSPTAKVRLTIHGDLEKAWPSVAQRLFDLVADDPRITLAGRFDNRRVPDIFAGIDVLVVPSRWLENSPNVILEAFACRTPVIASNLGGMAELIDHGRNGFLFPTGNAEALASLLQAVVDDRTWLEKWTKNLPAVKSTEQEIDELLHVYHAVTDRRGHR